MENQKLTVALRVMSQQILMSHTFLGNHTAPCRDLSITSTRLANLSIFRHIFDRFSQRVECLHPKAENKETPAPINRKQSRKGIRGQRVKGRTIVVACQTFIHGAMDGMDRRLSQ